MEFENTLRLVFGDLAYQSAGEEGNPVARRKRLRDLCRCLARHISALDTTEHHREMLLGEIDRFQAALKATREPSWRMIYTLLRFAARLLGYDYQSGVRPYTPIYERTENQRFTAALLDRKEGRTFFYSMKNNAIAIRREIAQSLKKKGLDDFVIALVLNTSEYQVKKMRRGL